MITLENGELIGSLGDPLLERNYETKVSLGRLVSQLKSTNF